MNTIRIPLDQLDNAEIEKLRAMARARGIKKREQADDCIPHISRDGVILPSFIQQSLWLIAQMKDAEAIYHVPSALRLRGELDVDALQSSLDAVFANHDALRSVFVDMDGNPRVELLPSSHGVPLRKNDLREVPDAEARLGEITIDEASRPFDLAQGPMIRALLVRLDDDDHVFLLTLHHIIADGWSMALFARELGIHYTCFVEGSDKVVSPPSIQYPDYAAWQRHRLSGERIQKHVAYWQQQLVDAPAFLDLPTDRARPARQSYAGAYLPFAIDAGLTRELKKFNQKHGVTLFMTLMAAWAVVLSRLSGQRDLVIGMPTANRNRPDIEATIGCFINTLALRLDLRDVRSLADIVATVRTAALGAQDHQELPFEQVVEMVEPPRTLGRHPLFQVMFAWQNNARDVPELAGLDVRAADLAQEVARYDIKLDLYEEGDGIAGGFIYATALFDQATIARHRDYLLNVLRAMVRDDSRCVSDVKIVDAHEQEQQQSWNATDRAYAHEATLAQLFEEQVGRTPEWIAVEAQGHVLSYEQLNAQANRLAHYLIERGVGPDVRVAICVERSVAMVVGMLAILKAGGAYVPLDPVYSSERLGQILGDAGALMVLVDAAGREALGEALDPCIVVLALDGAGDAGTVCAWGSYPGSDPARPTLTSRHLAYVIYTSGSTGIPKGVMVEQRSVVNFWSAIRGSIYPEEASGWRVGWNASFSFDMSIKAFSQLLSGHTVVLIPQEVRASACALRSFLDEQRIDAFDTTPSQLRALLEEGWLADTSRERTVLIGGEAVSPGMWARLTQATNLRCFNMYGPTECTVDATVGPMHASDSHPHIGRPLANMRIYILDAQAQPVPRGVVGEIYIAGDGIARGYLNRAELTAERFMRDPFVADATARMYRTGDVGRFLADGRVEYLGRNDHQVKIRGFRVELGEIEARLAEHTAVREAAVVATEEAGGEKRLVAYVIAAGAQEGPLALSLRAHLSERLPEYMVPSAYVQLDEWPLTKNGKLDRQALPAPDEDAFVKRRYEAPQSGTEKVLAGMWCELLGVERVGRHDHFFELGGHSLLAVQFMVKVRQVFDVTIALRDLFINPTLQEFASLIGLSGPAAEHNNVVPVRRGGSETPLFLVHPGGGGIDYVRKLAPWIDAQIPIYGLEATGLVPRQEPLHSVEDMAARYFQAMRTIQPAGPYRIAGWSAGGVIAYEIAAQIMMAGEQIAYLGMIDAFHPDTAERLDPFDAKVELLEWLSRHVNESDWKVLIAVAENQSFEALVDHFYTCGIALKGVDVPPKLDAQAIRSILATRHAIRSSIANYVPEPIALDVEFFEASDGNVLSSTAWRPLLGGRLRVNCVGGNHMSMLEDLVHLAFLGTSITEELIGDRLQKV